MLKYLIQIFWIICFIISFSILVVIPVLYNMKSNFIAESPVYVFENNWTILLNEKFYINNLSFTCKINRAKGKFNLLNILSDNEELLNYPAIYMKLKIWIKSDFFIKALNRN